jgi:hypothetical protein
LASRPRWVVGVAAARGGEHQEARRREGEYGRSAPQLGADHDARA